MEPQFPGLASLPYSTSEKWPYKPRGSPTLTAAMPFDVCVELLQMVQNGAVCVNRPEWAHITRLQMELHLLLPHWVQAIGAGLQSTSWAGALSWSLLLEPKLLLVHCVPHMSVIRAVRTGMGIQTSLSLCSMIVRPPELWAGATTSSFKKLFLTALFFLLSLLTSSLFVSLFTLI